MAIQPTMLRPAAPRPAWQVAAGLVLPVPALILLVTSYVEPAVWTVNGSFHRFTGLRLGAGATGGPPAGLDNYRRAFDAGLGSALARALVLALAALAVALVLAPALAWAAQRSGRTSRWITRAALTVPLAGFAPLAIAAAQHASGRPAFAAFWLGTFGLVAAVATLVYLAALRSARDPWRNALLGGALVALGVLAVVLQEFVFSYVYQLGPGHDGSPVLLALRAGLVQFNFGLASAISTVVLVPVMLLGLAATVLIIRPGLRMQVAPEPAEPFARPAARRFALWAVLLVATLIAIAAGLGPWLLHIGNDTAGLPPTFVNTWVPPLISTAVGVTVAALAAFGISALRPLGRHSEWLLLPFGLFLFVGTGPLALRAYAAGATAGRLDSLLGLIPPSWVTIPAMFALALLFRGQALRRDVLLQEGRPASWATVVLPALPMLAVAYVATWVVQTQDGLWSYVTGTPEHPTGQNALLMALASWQGEPLPYARALPLPMLIVLLLLGVAAQLLYLDRLALHSGLPERDHPPRT